MFTYGSKLLCLVGYSVATDHPLAFSDCWGGLKVDPCDRPPSERKTSQMLGGSIDVCSYS